MDFSWEQPQWPQSSYIEYAIDYDTERRRPRRNDLMDENFFHWTAEFEASFSNHGRAFRSNRPMHRNQGPAEVMAQLLGKRRAKDAGGDHARDKRRVQSEGVRKHDQAAVPGYKFVKRLTPGGMSEAVSLVKHQESGKLYIEKRVRVDESNAKRSSAELGALKIIKLYGHEHLNIMKTHFWEDNTRLCSFVVEYCDKGSLQDRLDAAIKTKTNFPEDFLWKIMVSVAKGLAFLHHGIGDVKKGRPQKDWLQISHLDLKPQNIFLSSTGQRGPHPRVVLGDFGCAVSLLDKMLGLEHPWRQSCGTPEWYPPEGIVKDGRHEKCKYGPKTDIWQLGATIHVLCRLLQLPSRSSLVDRKRILGKNYSEDLVKAASHCAVDEYGVRPGAQRLANFLIEGAKKAHIEYVE